MTAPVVAEVGFGATWSTPDDEIVWTDVTEWVSDRRAPVRVQRGATRAFGRVDTGTCALTLLNADRRFDPAHAAGPHHGLLVPGVPIRVAAVDGPVVFRGTVGSWSQHYERTDMLVCRVEAWDGFDRLAREQMVPSPWADAVRQVVVDRRLWPLDEQVGVQATDRRLGGWLTPGRYTTDVAGRSQRVDIGVGHHGVEVDRRLRVTAPNPSSLPVLSMLAVMVDVARVDLTDGQTIPLIDTSTGVDAFTVGGAANPNFVFALNVINAETMTAQLRYYTIGHATGSLVYSHRSPTFSIDRPRVVGLAAGTLLPGPLPYHDFFVDGQPTGAIVVEDTVGSYAPASGTLIGWSRAPAATGIGTSTGVIAGVAAWSPVEQSSDADNHAAVAACIDPWAGDTTGARIDRVLDLAGWPADRRAVDTGRTTLGGAILTTHERVLDYLRIAADTEAGRLFVAADGALTFHDRHRPFDAEPVLRIVSGRGTHPYFQAVDRLDDDQLTTNAVQATRRGGSGALVEDPASVAELGRQRTNLATINQGDDTDRMLAAWIVANRSLPAERIPTIRVPVHGVDPAQRNTFVGLELGDVVEVQHDIGVGDPVTLTVVVEGVRHEVTAAEWWTDLYLGPAPSWRMFEIDDSEGSGDVLWTESMVLIAEPLTSTATTVTVGVSPGAEWDTSAGFDAVLAPPDTLVARPWHERVTVTGITQTAPTELVLDVVRGVDGFALDLPAWSVVLPTNVGLDY